MAGSGVSRAGATNSGSATDLHADSPVGAELVGPAARLTPRVGRPRATVEVVVGGSIATRLIKDADGYWSVETAVRRGNRYQFRIDGADKLVSRSGVALPARRPARSVARSSIRRRFAWTRARVARRARSRAR